MKLLVIDLCNYKDYPLGGQLSFVKNLIQVVGNEAKLVGISTDKNEIIGKWNKKNINGIAYDFFSVARIKKKFTRPIIPARLRSYLLLKPFIHEIFRLQNYDWIFIQAPEILFCIPDKYLSKTFIVLPGVENPLSISRYPIARLFQCFYDFFFMRKVAKVSKIFASADDFELEKFVKRSKGKIHRENLIKYPTRYDGNIYYERDKNQSRHILNIVETAIIITTVGRLAWFKGWKFMIDSFVLFHAKEKNSYLYFVGDGEDRQLVEAYIKEVHLENCIFLTGSMQPKDVSTYLNASDVFIMGSYKEGWSTTLVEACACSIPCVVTNFSSAEEMIQDNRNGFVVRERSEQTFCNKIFESLHLDRRQIIDYNKRYKSLDIKCMWKSIESEINC